jgi:hypothetical protein
MRSCKLVPDAVDVATVTVTAEVTLPSGFCAVSVYVVVCVGTTRTEVPGTTPTPLSIEVELALVATHERSELWPYDIDDGFAVNDVIDGADCATIAEHVLVATVDEASVAWMLIEYVPGVYETVCDVVVAPLPHKSATGATPPTGDAVHVMLDAAGVPAHVTDKAVVSALATPKESKTLAATAEALIVRRFIWLILYTT